MALAGRLQLCDHELVELMSVNLYYLYLAYYGSTGSGTTPPPHLHVLITLLDP